MVLLLPCSYQVGELLRHFHIMLCYNDLPRSFSSQHCAFSQISCCRMFLGEAPRHSASVHVKVRFGPEPAANEIHLPPLTTS